MMGIISINNCSLNGLCRGENAAFACGATGVHPLHLLNTGNDEPGVMLPGHCFTIEVRLSAIVFYLK